MFSCEICKIFKNILFDEHPRTTTSIQLIVIYLFIYLFYLFIYSFFNVDNLFFLVFWLDSLMFICFHISSQVSELMTPLLVLTLGSSEMSRKKFIYLFYLFILYLKLTKNRKISVYNKISITIRYVNYLQ